MTSSSPIVLVFGGSRGIGAACVQAFAATGWQVASTYATKSSDDAPGRQYQVDIRDAASVARVFEQVAADLGGAPQAVIANAGINVPAGPVASFKPDDFRLLMEVNVVGAFNVLAEAARRVRDGGAIVAITTSLVRHAVPGTGPYAASKAAVESLVRSMAKELAPRGVRVNAVAPGPVDTDLFNAGKTEEAKQRMAAFSPFNRIGRPNEVAEVVRFLASEQASWVHGQIVQPNGGMV
ncbi:Short-chain dehydrogenase precursor [Bradyrhizobium sp. STM 3843]|uniref:SDR family NAD(P)-dependent oxidoreductase n=1 Tax=Bradyrhizobium sp. STM 3843 TaxID=551947 RepID=UPI000240A439|nr:SDR family oxidoreductase [Bradyrhizobium sp. STM 3843]CCE04390.1 Short-chain dehydrogenase precursor [Bradyrhizobium sp. STM 3843]